MSMSPRIGASGLHPGASTVRIARALIGVTPQQLAASIGLPADRLGDAWASCPIPSLERLSSAVGTIMSRYREGSGTPPPPTGKIAPDASELETVLRDFIALRHAWESHEARLLAAWMTRHSAGRREGNPAIIRPPSPIEPASAAKASHRRALLVDDSSDTLIVVGAFLEDLGFDVVHATNAESALSVLGEGTPIDLLVTDHVMPGMSGKELVIQARERDSRLPALIITGYADCGDLADLPDGGTLLSKPLRRAELSRRIR